MPADVVKRLMEFHSSVSKSEDQQAFIDGLNREEIIKVIPDIFMSNAPSGLIQVLLDGLTNSSRNRDGLLLRVMEVVLDELSEGDIPQQKAVEVVEVLGFKCCQLNADELAKLVQHCLLFLQNGRELKGKWLSLFPLLMSELSKQSRVTVDAETISGLAYCDQIISFLCNIQISAGDAVAFSGILRELELPLTSVNRLIEKMCALLPKMEPQEVPPLLYQLLFLCDRSNHLVPVQHVAQYFQEKLGSSGPLNEKTSMCGESMDIEAIESISPRETLMAKATSIYHISSAASAGHSLSKEFPKFLRSHINIPEAIMVPFVLEVALSLGGLPQLRDVIDVLKSVVQKCVHLNLKMRQSAWLREIMSDQILQVEEHLINVMVQCTAEWDSIVKGLELLAFSLLELRGPGLPPRSGTGGAASNAVPTNPVPVASQPGQQTRTVLQQCWKIGSNILFQMIKKFPDSAQNIVQKLADRLQDNGNDAQYIDTITLLVQQAPLTMLDCKNSLMSMIYNMDYCGVTSASRLYSAISPLFRSAPALRETALLVLRKLMYSCSEEARQVAVVGFLQILKHFRYFSSTLQGIASSQSIASSSSSMSSSQSAIDLHQHSSANTNRVLCTELIKRLQSSLNQQPVVRQTLYESLPEVVSRNPELVPECVKMLRNHLKFYVEQQTVIQLDLCVSKGDKGYVQVIEPLGHSMQAMLQIILRSGLKKRFDRADIDAETADEVDQGLLMLRKVATSLSEATKEDFDLDETGESSVKAQTLMSTCVALIDLCLANNATTDRQWAQILVNIFNLNAQLASTLKESTGKGKGKGKKKDAADDAAPVIKKSHVEMSSLSLQNLSHFLSALFAPTDDDEVQEGLTLLKASSNSALHLWIMESALRKCRQLRISGVVEGLSAESLIKYCGILGRALILCCTEKRSGVERESAIFCMAFECFYELVQAVFMHHAPKMLRFLAAVNGVEMLPPGSSVQQQILPTLDTFQKFLDEMLSGQETESVMAKASLPIIGTLTVLSDQLEPVSPKYDQLLEWTQQLCRDVECSEATVVKTLLTFLVHLHLTSKPSPDIILELARNVRSTIGDLNESVNGSTLSNKFAIINEDTSNVALAIVTASIDHLLVITELAHHRIGTTDDISSPIERTIYARLMTVVSTLSELVRTDFSPGSSSELVLKMACSLYTTMSHVSKRQGKVIDKQFEKLCKLMATNVTPFVYAFISHLEGAQDKESSKKGKKLKAKTDTDQDVQRVLKRTRAIPMLIFALEHFSKNLMTISKKTKIDLSFGFKPGTSRDFRIKENLLNGEEDEPEEEPMEDEEEEEGNENRSTTGGPVKRPLMYAMSGNQGGKGSKRGRGRGRK